jgi:hypothetical protein
MAIVGCQRPIRARQKILKEEIRGGTILGGAGLLGSAR